MTAQVNTSPPPPEVDLDQPLLVVRIHPSDDRRTFFGYASAISREGLRIDATLPREEGSSYELGIPLPRPLEGEVCCRCEVAWKRDWARRRSPGMGLRFIDLPEETAARLEAWIASEQSRAVYRADAA